MVKESVLRSSDMYSVKVAQASWHSKFTVEDVASTTNYQSNIFAWLQTVARPQGVEIANTYLCPRTGVVTTCEYGILHPIQLKIPPENTHTLKCWLVYCNLHVIKFLIQCPEKMNHA